MALVYPDYELMDSNGVSAKDIEPVMADNKEALNKSLANYEMISAIHIYPTEFEKTPKKSIKRYLYDR